MAEQENTNKPLSVSQAMALAKGALEACTVTLIGEVSEVSNKAGYKAVYFTVKDENASLPAMMWNNRYAAAGLDLRVGMLVQLTGRFTLYAAKGRMNFDVFSLSLAGEGDLRLKVANLAKKLEAEGLLDSARKRPLPSFPQTIGLVTSPRGAAVHDVLRTMRRRYPSARILLAGVPVEGSDAPGHLCQALQTVADSGAELVLLVRGGGSFEDLMPFNDENLARTIAALPIPVVTGIGHEPDNSIADMVADLRASTPTAAAEAATPNSVELSAALAAQMAHINRMLQTRLQQSSARLDAMATRPVLNDPNQLITQQALALDAAFDRLQRAIPANLMRDANHLQQTSIHLKNLGKTLIEASSARLATQAARLEDLSPLSILGRGYALAKNKEGKLVSSISTVAEGEALELTVADGLINCTVDSCTYADRELVSWKEDS